MNHDRDEQIGGLCVAIAAAIVLAAGVALIVVGFWH